MKSVLLRPALFIAAAFLIAPAPAHAQVEQAASTGKLALTSSNMEARAAFSDAWYQFANVHFSRADSLSKVALSLDPNFGLARALRTIIVTNLTAAQREEELNRAVADAARGSTGELLAAAVMRAGLLGRTAEATALADAAVALMPNDPNIAFLRITRSGFGGATTADLAELTKKFPDFAAAFNLLAYRRWTDGDRAGALEAAQQYVRLAPTHPNSHDTYGEILQFAGRLPEALQHYQRSIELDHMYAAGESGIAEVHMLMGHPAVARDAYTKAAASAGTPAGRLNATANAALMFVLEGKHRDAVRELSAVAATAERENLAPQAAAYYRSLALIQAVFGDKKTVAGHLAKAAAAAGAQVPPTQHRFSALAFAASGQIDLAKAAAAEYDRALANGTPAQRATVREVHGVVAVAEKDYARARSELAQAGAAPFGKALLAEALKKSGNNAEAQTIKQQIMSAGTATFLDVLARAKVQKL